MAGFLSLSRDITEWGWYKDANTLRVFIHLLFKANWKDGEYLGHKIERGQLVTGRKELAEELGLSERNIRTAIEHLKSTNEVAIKSTNKFSIITICKYNRWTGNEVQRDQQTDQQTDQQPTNNRPTTDQQPTTIEEEKKEINKEDTIVSKKAAEASLADKPLWKTSYEEYKRLFLEAKESLLADREFKEKQYSYYPNIDYEKSLDKSLDYWLDESTWKKVSRERAKTIRPKERITKNFDKNRIYKPFNGKSADVSYPKSVDDVKSEDINSTWDYFLFWAEKNNVHELYTKMNCGFPENDAQYQRLLKHTVGGARGFAYVVLVFVRDGWKGYEDDRGFMWIYSNYIKANGLYTE